MPQTIEAKEKVMRAVAMDQFGGPETLKVKTIPLPELAADEVLIKVEAAGVGAWDSFEREGGFKEMMPHEPRFPYVLGTDGAGTIAAVGKQVSRFKEGDRVYALELANPKGGFYAEYAAVKAEHASLIPGKLTMEEAAVLGSDALTALKGLDEVLELKSEDSLMIFGASGGIGHLAVQLAKRMGARVFAIASGDDGVALVRRLGADAVVDGRKDDVLAAARQFAPAGLNAALVTAGGDAANNALLAVRKGGRVAHPNGVSPAPQAAPEVTIKAYDGEANPKAIEKLNRLIESGPFEVCVDRTYPLDEAAKAQEDLNQHHLGKFALLVS